MVCLPPKVDNDRDSLSALKQYLSSRGVVTDSTCMFEMPFHATPVGNDLTMVFGVAVA
jgi:hypothetical protein